MMLACNFTNSNTPPWVFFLFFKLNKWYQIAQRILYACSFHALLCFYALFMLYAMIFDKTNDSCTFLIEECLMVFVWQIRRWCFLKIFWYCKSCYFSYRLIRSSSFSTPKLYFIFFFADNIPADYNPNLPN